MARSREPLLDEAQHRRELREDEDAAPLGEQLDQHLIQPVELG